MNDTSKENELQELRQLVKDQTHHMLRAQDLMIGLEAEANTARALAKDTRNREPLVAEITSLKSSLSYRLGYALTTPFRVLRRGITFFKRCVRAVLRRVRAKVGI